MTSSLSLFLSMGTALVNLIQGVCVLLATTEHVMAISDGVAMMTRYIDRVLIDWFTNCAKSKLLPSDIMSQGDLYM